MSSTPTTHASFSSRLTRAILPPLFISLAAPAFSQEYHMLTADEAEVRNGELVSVKIGKKDFERIEVPSELGGEQDAQDCDYMGNQSIATKFDGNKLDMDGFSECGFAIGKYGQSSEIVTELLVRTFSKKGFKETNKGSRLILKVNGENMELVTPLGSCCPAAHTTYWGTDGILGLLGGSETWVFATDAKYPLSKEQLEKLLKHGFSKYRLQVEGDVREGELDDKKLKKLTHKLDKAYKKIAKIPADMNDLSDF